MAEDILQEVYAQEQAEVEQRLYAIMAAVQAQDIALLETYHLWGPKFTKFDDWEPLERQDAETAKRTERDGIGGVKSFATRIRHLKVDVFGRVAIATFVFDYEMTLITNDPIATSARTTMVFVKRGSDWLITHEHLSAFKANL